MFYLTVCCNNFNRNQEKNSLLIKKNDFANGIAIFPPEMHIDKNDHILPPSTPLPPLTFF